MIQTFKEKEEKTYGEAHRDESIKRKVNMKHRKRQGTFPAQTFTG